MKTRNLHIAKKLVYYKTLWGTDNKCFYCHEPLTLKTRTLDHLIPRARGGSNNIKNVVLCCRPCNNAKADLTVSEFVDFCARYGGIHSVKREFGTSANSRGDIRKTFISKEEN